MKIGVALSGGGARAIAHLGMLQVMEEHGIKPDCYAGVSAGAIAGALLAKGYSPLEVMEIIRETKLINMIRPAWTLLGLLKMDKVEEILLQYLETDRFEALPLPLTVAAVQVRQGTIRYFNSGPLVKVLAASSSIPAIFSPVEIEGELYIDGGMIDNMPVKPLEGQAGFVIGMHCNPIDPDFVSSSAKDLIERSLLLAISNATYHRALQPDLLLDPPGLSGFKVFDFGKAEEIFAIGERYARENISKFEFLKQA